eukprot:4188039-Amphidinium_carterae.1
MLCTSLPAASQRGSGRPQCMIATCSWVQSIVMRHPFLMTDPQPSGANSTMLVLTTDRGIWPASSLWLALARR